MGALALAGSQRSESPSKVERLGGKLANFGGRVLQPRVAIQHPSLLILATDSEVIRLAVDVDQQVTDRVELAHRDDLAIDPRRRPPISGDFPRDDEMLLVRLDALFIQQRPHLRAPSAVQLEQRLDTRSPRPGAHDIAGRAIAEHEAKRIEQDRLARPVSPVRTCMPGPKVMRLDG